MLVGKCFECNDSILNMASNFEYVLHFEYGIEVWCDIQNVIFCIQRVFVNLTSI